MVCEGVYLSVGRILVAIDGYMSAVKCNGGDFRRGRGIYINGMEGGGTIDYKAKGW